MSDAKIAIIKAFLNFMLGDNTWIKKPKSAINAIKTPIQNKITNMAYCIIKCE